MVLAELNAYVSRPIAPTRRIALGRSELPCDPAPGMGGLLLGGIVATFAPALDDDTRQDLVALMGEVERGQRIPQPRMRHRFQTDHVGLQQISYRLLGNGDRLSFHFENDKATPSQHVLAAVYSSGRLDHKARRGVSTMMRRALGFPGGDDADLIKFLSGRTRAGVQILSDPVVWALDVLQLRTVVEDSAAGSGGARGAPKGGRGRGGADEQPLGLPAAPLKLPSRAEIQRAFRRQLRHSHPDHGAERAGAAQRIADLAEARRILLER